MAIIKGSFFYRGKREYKYEVNVHDADGFKCSGYNINVINPEGKSAIVNWNFRHRGIDDSIRDHIEFLSKKEKQLSS